MVLDHVINFGHMPGVRRGLALAVLVSAGGALFAAQAGDVFPLLDILPHFTGHFIGACLSALLAILVQRRALAILVAGFIVTLAVHALAGYANQHAAALPSHELPPPEKARALTVLSLNAWHSNRSPDALVSYLRRANADVVLLSEFGPARVGLLKQLKTVFPYQVQCVRVWYCSLALLSRYPILASRSLLPTGRRPPIVWARVRARGGSGAAITVVGTHAYRPTRNPWKHDRHMRALTRFVRSLKGPVVVAGDFNATPYAASYQRFARESGLTTAGAFQPSWPAWPLNLPQFAIDHIFVSHDLEFTGRGLGPQVGSDHLPIWASLRLR